MNTRITAVSLPLPLCHCSPFNQKAWLHLPYKSSRISTCTATSQVYANIPSFEYIIVTKVPAHLGEE